MCFTRIWCKLTPDSLDYGVFFRERGRNRKNEDSSIYILFAQTERLVIMERGKLEIFWGLLNVLSVT